MEIVFSKKYLNDIESDDFRVILNVNNLNLELFIC